MPWKYGTEHFDIIKQKIRVFFSTCKFCLNLAIFQQFWSFLSIIVVVVAFVVFVVIAKSVYIYLEIGSGIYDCFGNKNMLDKGESTTQLNVAVMRVICCAEFEAFQVKMAKEMRNARFAICLMSVRFRIAPTGALESINQTETEPAEQHRKCVLMALIFWCVFMLAEYPFLIELILIRSEKVFQHLMEYLVSLVKRMSIPHKDCIKFSSFSLPSKQNFSHLAVFRCAFSTIFFTLLSIRCAMRCGWIKDELVMCETSVKDKQSVWLTRHNAAWLFPFWYFDYLIMSDIVGSVLMFAERKITTPTEGEEKTIPRKEQRRSQRKIKITSRTN